MRKEPPFQHRGSFLYECLVIHSRLQPKRHTFSYRVFMLSLDLDDLPRSPWLSYHRFNLFSLEDRDHVALGKKGIKANLLEWLTQQDIEVPSNICVRLVAFPRVLGYAFKPVSFFYLTYPDGSPFLSVAEVGNTFGEMKLYPVDTREEKGWRRKVTKNFYVSPFSDPGDTFDFRLGDPGEELKVNIDNLKDDQKVLVSAVRGRAKAFTSARLLWFSLKYPLLSLKIIGLIHWQALLLWVRGVPYFKKADKISSQTEVLKPHRSLSKDST